MKLINEFFFSIVIPVYNEQDNISKLILEIYSADIKNFELIIVDDASNDNTIKILEKLKIKYEFKIIKLDTNSGQSIAIKTGINNSSYNNIITIDGDCQNNPKDIPKLINTYCSNEAIKLVGGIRQKRRDSYIKKISSKLANKVRRYILNDDCDDTGCSLKVFDKKIFLSFVFFDGIHRFLPALFKGYGHSTAFLYVDHRNRVHGVSKYGTFKRLIKGIKDLYMVYNHLKKRNA